MMEDPAMTQDPVEQPSQSEEKKLSREDHLYLDNVQLRIMNLGFKEGELRQEFQEIQSEKVRLQKEWMKLRKDFEERYGIDFDKQEIRASDGAIVPAGSTPRPPR